MPSDLEIANIALMRLSQAPISAFGENPGTGILSKSHYDQERDALLRSIPWNFARKWTSLAQLSLAPLSLSFLPNSASPGSIVFTNAYQLPLDFLRLYRFSPKDSHWRIVGKAIYTDAIPSGAGGVLLGLQPLGSDGTDNQPPTPFSVGSNSVGIEYIFKNIDPESWDVTFIETFIWKLVKDLSFGVVSLIEVYKIASAEFDKSVVNAAFINGAEQWPDEFWNTQLTDVRYGYSNQGFGGT